MKHETKNLLERLKTESNATGEELRSLLELHEKSDLEELFRAAYEIKMAYVGNKVRLRGLIEISNICSKNCYYCGIRKDNHDVPRYFMSDDEIVAAAKWAMDAGFGSLVLQGGERSDKPFVDRIEQLLRRIMREMPREPGITLSLGEQTEETYRRWHEAGARRYLLRIEASNPDLYAKLHPADHSHANRLECLMRIRKAGYQLGTGVMMGLPFQTPEDTANDILFFQKMDVDMIGMGPYVVHDQTPLAQYVKNFDPLRQVELGLKTIAVTRLLLKDVNIASTTALQALHPDGREQGLLAGANVIMPNVSDPQFRSAYQLYRGKPGLNDTPGGSLDALEKEIARAGETIAYHEWGDSPHFKKRTQPQEPSK